MPLWGAHLVSLDINGNTRAFSIVSQPVVLRSGRMKWFDPDPARIGTHHVQVFIPSVDAKELPIPKGQAYWVDECLKVLGTQFGGATAFPPSRGVWRDDSGHLVYDNTVIVFSYVAESDLTGEA